MSFESVLQGALYLLAVALLVVYVAFLVEAGSAKRWGWFWLMFLFAPSAMVYAVVRRSEAKK